MPKKLTDKQCQALGITKFQVWRRVRRMVRRGDVGRGDSRREVAVAVALELSDSPEFVGAWDDVDWDAVVKRIEQILELLAKFIPIFMSFA